METNQCEYITSSNRLQTKIQSLHGLDKSLIEPTEKLLESCSSTDSLRSILEIYLYLNRSKNSVKFLKEALETNRYTDELIKAKLMDVIEKLEKNVGLLDHKMSSYKDSILQKNAELTFSSLKVRLNDDIKLKNILHNITLSYEDPANDALYGNFLRKSLTELEALSNTQQAENLKKLIRLKEECVRRLNNLQAPLEFSKTLENLNVQKDLKQACTSLESLRNLCDILISTDN